MHWQNTVIDKFSLVITFGLEQEPLQTQIDPVCFTLVNIILISQSWINMVVHIISVAFTGFIMYLANPGSDLFSWHPTCMSVAFMLLLLQAIILFSPESSLFPTTPKQVSYKFTNAPTGITAWFTLVHSWLSINLFNPYFRKKFNYIGFFMHLGYFLPFSDLQAYILTKKLTVGNILSRGMPNLAL